MKVNAIVCPKCKDTIYSRARHDYHTCSCGEISIDGGFDYQKVSFKTKPPKNKEIEINVSKKTLYDDWHYKINQFGLIKGEENG